MNNVLLIAYLDIKESLRSKWFLFYLITFGGLIAIFFITGVTESRVLGFSGLSRLLLLFIQICIVILPVFILISTARTITNEKESNSLEYLLSFPISLREYFLGKVLGRLFGAFTPVFLSLVLAVVWAMLNSSIIAWELVLHYCALLFSLSFSFLGISFLISSIAKNQENAVAIAFLAWLFLLAFMDLLLIGILMKSGIKDEIIYAIALLNPMEVFRISAISLFDPKLSVIGPAAYFILDLFGNANFIVYSIFYPILLGIICLYFGYIIFRKKDLV